MKCKQILPGFKLVLPCPFPKTVTITPQAPPVCVCMYVYKYVCEVVVVVVVVSKRLLNELGRLADLNRWRREKRMKRKLLTPFFFSHKHTITCGNPSEIKRAYLTWNQAEQHFFFFVVQCKAFSYWLVVDQFNVDVQKIVCPIYKD